MYSLIVYFIISCISIIYSFHLFINYLRIYYLLYYSFIRNLLFSILFIYTYFTIHLYVFYYSFIHILLFTYTSLLFTYTYYYSFIHILLFTYTYFYYSLLTITIHYLPFTIYHLLFNIYYLLLTIYYLSKKSIPYGV